MRAEDGRHAQHASVVALLRAPSFARGHRHFARRLHKAAERCSQLNSATSSAYRSLHPIQHSAHAAPRQILVAFKIQQTEQAV